MRQFKAKRVTTGRSFTGGKSKDSDRLSASNRGYDYAWKKLRDRFIQKHPTCYYCHGKAQQVDHIEPFTDLQDPKRLAWTNLRSVCVSCHRKAEWARRKGRELKPLNRPGAG